MRQSEHRSMSSSSCVENLPVSRALRQRRPHHVANDVEMELFHDAACRALIAALAPEHCALHPVVHECVFPIGNFPGVPTSSRYAECSSSASDNDGNTNTINQKSNFAGTDAAAAAAAGRHRHSTASSVGDSRGCNPDAARMWLASLLFLHRARFCVAWWLHAESVATLEAGVLDMLDALDPSGCSAVVAQPGPLALPVLATLAELQEAGRQSIVVVLDRASEDTLVHFLAKHAPRWNVHVVVVADAHLGRASKAQQLARVNSDFRLPNPHIGAAPRTLSQMVESSGDSASDARTDGDEDAAARSGGNERFLLESVREALRFARWSSTGDDADADADADAAVNLASSPVVLLPARGDRERSGAVSPSFDDEGSGGSALMGKAALAGDSFSNSGILGTGASGGSGRRAAASRAPRGRVPAAPVRHVARVARGDAPGAPVAGPGAGRARPAAHFPGAQPRRGSARRRREARVRRRREARRASAQLQAHLSARAACVCHDSVRAPAIAGGVRGGRRWAATRIVAVTVDFVVVVSSAVPPRRR